MSSSQNFKEDAKMKARREQAQETNAGAEQAERQKNKESWGDKAKEMGEKAKSHLNPLGGNPTDNKGKK
ncbi:MAG: hypothetical protein Q9162_003496 [Coniocarpon cinnabarinum]